MAKVSVDLGEDTKDTDVEKKIKEITAPLLSVSKSKKIALKDARRVQFAFSNVPEPIKLAFAAAAASRGITQKEMLYECLRAGGIDIPSIEAMDGRRR